MNGVPLHCVAPSYVIATSTKIDVSSVDVSSYDDAYFARTEESLKGELFEGDAPKPSIVSDQRKADQKTVNAALMKAVGSVVPMLESYLKAKFSLKGGEKPHKMIISCYWKQIKIKHYCNNRDIFIIYKEFRLRNICQKF